MVATHAYIHCALIGWLHRYKGTWDAFRLIVKEDGVRGLWKGWIPNCQRAAVVCLGGDYRLLVHILLCDVPVQI